MHLNKIKTTTDIYPSTLSFNYPKLNSLINDLDLPFIITIIDTNTDADTDTEIDTETPVIDIKVYAIILVLIILVITREIIQ